MVRRVDSEPATVPRDGDCRDGRVRCRLYRRQRWKRRWDDDGGTTAGATTTGGAIGTDERTPTDGRPTTETTTAETTETAEARRTTDRTDTTSVKASDSTSDATTGNPYRRPTPMGTPTAAGLAIVEIYPTQGQQGFISGEYVALRNTGDESLDLSGYGLSTPDRSGEPIDTYSLTLEPGATLYALIRSGEGTILATSPPGYLRFAGFNDPVLDDEARHRRRH